MAGQTLASTKLALLAQVESTVVYLTTKHLHGISACSKQNPNQICLILWRWPCPKHVN